MQMRDLINAISAGLSALADEIDVKNDSIVKALFLTAFPMAHRLEMLIQGKKVAILYCFAL